MVDLHSHILPGLDDGAPDTEASLAMARAAVRDGTRTIAATPHIDLEHGVDPGTLGERVDVLNAVLRRAGVPLTVISGGEVAVTRLPDLGDPSLRALALGGGTCVLVESPYSAGVEILEELLFDLQVRGYMPLLAHPERCPAFQVDPDRLARLVERGVMCSITAGSMAGRFGETVRRFSLRLLRDGLVHDVASDAHDVARRPPGLRLGFEEAESRLPGILAQIDWYTRAAPAALLEHGVLPKRPEPPRPPSTWRQLLQRGGRR